MRVIDADALMDILADRLIKVSERYGVNSGVAGAVSGAMRLVEVQPTIELEQKKGKWLDPSREGIVSFSSAYAECSECGKKIYFGRMINFCPNCGSYNGGEQE